ncbi:MAG: hypothetical protein ACK55Z_34580, partial [bacterium]
RQSWGQTPQLESTDDGCPTQRESSRCPCHTTCCARPNPRPEDRPDAAAAPEPVGPRPAAGPATRCAAGRTDRSGSART